MKKIIWTLIILLLLVNPIYWNASSIKITDSNWNVKVIETKQSYKTVWDVIVFVFSWLQDVPKSYKYIELKYKDIEKWTKLYDSLQKAVYLDKMANLPIRLMPDRLADEFVTYQFVKAWFWVDLSKNKSPEDLKNKKVTKSTFLRIKKEFGSANLDDYSVDERVKVKKKILDNIIDRVEKSHIDTENFTKADLYDWAISWALSVTWDKYSVYFPPKKNKTFTQDLNGKFEWIWAYVDMSKPGEFIITKPIKNGPAFMSGIKAWDRVLEVDWKKVLKDISKKEVVSWLKWKKDTIVKVKIQRNDKILNFEIKRALVVEPAIETKIYGLDTYYIKLITFNDHIAPEFKKSLEEINKNKQIKRIILDVRWNLWGYLNQVSDMLNYFVPAWETKVSIKSADGEKNLISTGERIINPQNYKIHILVDESSASASEIFVWTLKDYYKNAVIFGKKTYWKWVVQTIIPFFDGSSFKYTTAKWFTWKTKINVNHNGIEPDYEVDFDFEKYKEDKIDSQLEYVIKY
jgi:carboxyl-terminal processing protease